MTFRFGVMEDILGRTGDDLFRAAADIGFDGVELCIRDAADSDWFSAEGRARIRSRAAASEIAVPSASLLEFNRYGYTSPDPAVRRTATEALHRSIEWAHSVDIPLLLVPFFDASEMTDDDRFDRVAAGFTEVAQEAEQAGVVLGIESTLAADRHLELLAAIGSPAVRIYYDVCNAWYWGHPAESDLTPLSDVVAQIHLKDGIDRPGGAMLGEGSVDFEAVAATIRAIEYRGWLVLESAAPDDRLADAARNLDFARRIFDRQPTAGQH